MTPLSIPFAAAPLAPLHSWYDALRCWRVMRADRRRIRAACEPTHEETPDTHLHLAA